MRPMMRVTPAEPGAVVALPESRRHLLADRLAGEAVGDELLQVVADLDLNLAILDRDEHEQAVVLAASDRCPCRDSRTSSPRIRVDVLYPASESTVATTTTSPRRLLQRADQRLQLTRARRDRSRWRSR